MMCTRGRTGTASRERGSAAFMSAQTPRAWRGLIDGPANKGVPKAESAGHIGRAHEIETQQIVECLERGLLTRRGGRRRKLGLERVPATAAPSNTRRTSGGSSASSAVKAAATLGGIPMSARRAG